MKEDPWFCVWAIIFIISYCGILAWPLIVLFIDEITDDIRKIYKRKGEENEY